MPEIKNQFTGGKMNKDLDERLVPKGEYRDAMNIQVATSDGSESGSVQNLLGNSEVATSAIFRQNFIEPSATCNGSVVDEAGDKAYFFIQTEDRSIRDGRNMIVEYDNSSDIVTPILVCHGNDILNFDPTRPVTGINIIDGILLWTDNYSEPKKINIARCKEGTNPNGLEHTRFVNAKRDITHNVTNPTAGSNILIREDHITVIKKSPLQAPELNPIAERAGHLYGEFRFDFSGFAAGDSIIIEIDRFGGGQLDYEVEDILLIQQIDNIINENFPILNSTTRLLIENISGSDYTCQILNMSGVSFTVDQYACDLDRSYDKLYLLKFPRFAIRYKYIDGEYSTFGPFSEVAFVPGGWNEDPDKVSYLPNTGYNLGMENRIRSLEIKRIVQNDIPDGAVQIDILYKESDSSVIYTVDEIKYTDSYWAQDSYNITKSTIKGIVPANQLLRPWDNVPRKALAQDLVGSRIVYANYEQNYDLNSFVPFMDVLLKIRADHSPTFKSIKSLRDYQLGVVYCDAYNRQTPVLSNAESSISISKLDSDKNTQIEIVPSQIAPSWATHQKFYIKETSAEYYNLSLDRHFDAEDGNIWLSFASNDRNKLDEEMSLYLKKRFNSNVSETSSTKYKIIDIKNEAPTYIKTRRVILGSVNDTSDTSFKVGSTLISTAAAANTTIPPTQQAMIPVVGENTIAIPLSLIDDTLLDNFHVRHNSPTVSDDGTTVSAGGPVPPNPLYIKILLKSSALNGDGNVLDQTDWYQIDNITLSVGAYYIIKLSKNFSNDIDFSHEATNGTTPGADITRSEGLIQGNEGTLVFQVAQDIVQNTSVFQGRFFVKILKDKNIIEAIVNQGRFQNVNILHSANFGYLANYDVEAITASSTGLSSSASLSAQISGINNTNTGLAFPLNSYWSQQTWRGIAQKLEDITSGVSRWVIDEAFATGEHALWGKNNFNVVLESYDGSAQAPGFEGVTNYGDNSTSISHNMASIGFGPTPWVNNIGSPNGSAYYYGLGHSATSDFEYHSVGLGVQPKTIDLSYIGVGRNVTDNNNFVDAYMEETPGNSEFAAANADNHSWLDRFKIFRGNSIGDEHDEKAAEFASGLIVGGFIRFTNDPNQVVYTITNVLIKYKQNYSENALDGNYPAALNSVSWKRWASRAHYNRRITWRLTLEAPVPGDDIGTDGLGNTTFNPTINNNTQVNLTGLPGTFCPIEIVTTNYLEGNDAPFPKNPAVFETEPKDQTALNIFHEASDTLPIQLGESKSYDFAPVGSYISPVGAGVTVTTTAPVPQRANVVEWRNNVVKFDEDVYYSLSGVPEFIKFYRTDGSYTTAKFIGQGSASNELKVNPNVSQNAVGLGWHNCYAFGNGVESNRIRDTFNSVFIDKGPKVSTTLEEGYEEERRNYGLIYSGLYNSISGVNNLNQFIQAEKITKDVNPTYGSIQKLHTRNSDLLAFCEDKILRISANKDALFNADGKAQLVATDRVLGQTVPFSGEFGISKNPESFASEAYRVYFTDKQRGAVMRLSKDGLTPISGAGMKDYFRDNLKDNILLIGSYDDKKDEYNITLPRTNTTVSFNEKVRGWVSFKSFVPQNAISCANEYLTFKEGRIWKHHNETVGRNTFYGQHSETDYSSVTVLLNQAPEIVKSFKTVNYEGSQSNVQQFTTDTTTGLTDNQYYNLEKKKGWYVDSLFTNKETGSIREFIEKEGKWFNYIKGDSIKHNEDNSIEINLDGSSTFDQASFAIQGLGIYRVTGPQPSN